MHEILEATRGKKRILVEVHLAQRFGFAKKAAPPSYPLALDEEMIALIHWARDHFGNAIPRRDVSAVTKRVFRELESRVEKEECAALAPPPAKAKPTTKSIPRSNRRHGGHEVENLRLACRAHNSWFAEMRYGKNYIQKRERFTTKAWRHEGESGAPACVDWTLVGLSPFPAEEARRSHAPPATWP